MAAQEFTLIANWSKVTLISTMCYLGSTSLPREITNVTVKTQNCTAGVKTSLFSWSFIPQETWRTE